MDGGIRQYFHDFKEFLSMNGINKGDIVYVGSDVSGILLGARREFDIKTKEERDGFLDAIIDSLQEAVGAEGTLLFPNFSWAFCRGELFDYYKSHGEIGVLNNYILDCRNDFLRTKHPIYNFMVWGKDAQHLKEMSNQDSWSADSPFGYLHQNNAKQVNLNVPFNKCITFQHYVEQSINVPYRYKKLFKGAYKDENGIVSERYYSMYVRDMKIMSRANLPEEFFTKTNAAHASIFHEYKVIFMELHQIFDIIKDDLINNAGNNIYNFENYSIDWNVKRTHADEIKISEGQIIQIKEDV